MALFGSVLRDDFRPEASDVDVLFRFLPDANVGVWDSVEMKEELRALFGRKVDLVEARLVDNPWRRKSIFESARTIYAA
jgi:predicted nucleotidyltransferase